MTVCLYTRLDDRVLTPCYVESEEDKVGGALEAATDQPDLANTDLTQNNVTATRRPICARVCVYGGGRPNAFLNRKEI